MQIVIKLEFLCHFVEKSRNIKFNENSSRGSQIVTCGRTDIMTLIVAFCNFANAPKSIQNVVSLNWTAELRRTLSEVFGVAWPCVQTQVYISQHVL
jgi:hypothetical protein